MQSIILTLATMAAAVSANLGSGIIVNNCGYDVLLDNVPSDDGVHTSVSKTIKANGGTYSQQWTSLTNGNGWSMKLSPGTAVDSIMQFEYTYSSLAPNDLWFDLSYVNGQPFESDWLISSSDPDTCVVKQTAYNNPTDDANGMQPMCSPSVSITVELCSNSGSGSSSGSSSSSSSAASPAAYSTSTSTSSTTSAAPATYSTTAATSTVASSSLTTFATVTTATSSDDGNVVTVVETATATSVVTQYTGHHWHQRAHAARHAAAHAN